MLPLLDRPWPHRHNIDGTYDSICPTCFQTIAHSPDESDLAREEEHHDCPGAPASPPYRRWVEL